MELRLGVVVGLGVLAFLTLREAVKIGVPAAGKIANAVDPTNQENVFYTAANAVTRKVTGDDSTTLGSSIYDWAPWNWSSRKAAADLVAPTPMSNTTKDATGPRVKDYAIQYGDANIYYPPIAGA